MQVLRMQGAWSATHPFHGYALDYAQKVNEMSRGRIRLEVLPAGAVAAPSGLLDAVEKGTLDGCHAAPVLWSGKEPTFSLFGAGPAVGLDAGLLLAWMRYGEGQALYEGLHASLLYRNVVGRLYGPLPPQPLGWFRQPVVSPAQFKGLRCHARGLPAQMLREMGAVVRDLPDDRILAEARRGALDAVTHAVGLPDRQLAEVFPVCMLQGYRQPAPVLEILLGRQRIEALEPDLQAVLMHAVDAASADLSWKAAYRQSVEFDALRRTRGVRFMKTPPPVLQAQLRAWRAVARRYARDNAFFPRVFSSQQAWARRAVRWSAETAVDPRPAYDYWFSGEDASLPPDRP